MTNASGENSQYIKKTFDEFRDLTTIVHKKELKCGGFLGGGGVKNEYKFQLRQVKTKELTTLVLDCTICAEDWFFARDGRLSFNCDQAIHHIPYHESNTNVEHIGKTAYCFEYGYYGMTPEFLETICSCAVLKIRITGESLYEEPHAKWCAEFQKYCRQFYNNVIDSSKFVDQAPAKTTQPTVAATAAGSGQAQQWGYKLGQNLAANTQLRTQAGKWLGLGLVGLVVIGVGNLLLPGLKKDAAQSPESMQPAVVSVPPPVEPVTRSPIEPATPQPDPPVVQNAPQEVAPPAPIQPAVVAEPVSPPPAVPSQNTNEAIAHVDVPKPRDVEKTPPPKEALNLAGAWSGFFQCGPHHFDQSPKGQRSFNVRATAEISAGKILMHRSDASYQEELSGAIDKQGKFRLDGEGFYFADRNRPWQTVVTGSIDKKSGTPRLEGGAVISFAGRNVRECSFVLARN